MTIHDVIIAGGGPGGSTLAALLTRSTKLDVLVVEAERFPREHIGESFTQRVTAVLAESGGLEKILASDCWVKKFGGYYAWGEGDPSLSLFEHRDYERDGILRWSFHADRPQMDAILLEHARSTGATVLEGVAIKSVDLGKDTHTIHLEDGREIRCRMFVDATGRVTDLASRQRKRYLSKYRNVAVWTHVTGGRRAEEAAGDWNLFGKLDVSCIGSYAFEDGWFWYIPVPKKIDGKVLMTHSLGVVTDPRVLKKPGKDFTSVETLLATARRTPILSELVANAVPVFETTNTATNYSMIADRFCSYDERWISIGDAAYFVDPLFSSGVAFAVNHAAAAALLIELTLSDDITESQKRDLFRDYDEGWRSLACSFATVLDQWYHAIARSHQNSIYWDSRSAGPLVDVRAATFNALVDTSVSPDLLLVITKGLAQLSDLTEGPLVDALRQGSDEPRDEQYVSLKPDVVVRPQLTLSVSLARLDLDVDRLRRYWEDPVRNREGVSRLYDKPFEGHCFEREKASLTCGPREGALELAKRFATPTCYGDVRESLSAHQRVLIRKLRGAEMLDVVDVDVAAE